jgi:hypothetical protein
MPSNSTLAHHGILGMKWGIRRTESQLSRARGASKGSSDARSNKNVKDLSDDELRKAVNRLQLEKQYSQLSASDTSSGKQYVAKIIKAGTTVAAVTTTALTLYNNIGKLKAIAEQAGKAGWKSTSISSL